MTQPSTLHFQFRHALFPVNVEIKNDVLCVRYAIKYFEIPIQSLRYMYVDDDVNREMRELILCFQNPKGRIRRARIFSDRDQPSFDNLVDTLSIRIGDGHLTDLDRRAAYQIMGSRSLERVMIPTLTFGVVFFVGLLLLPRLIHGLTGEANIVSMNQFVPSNLSGSYLDLREASVDLQTVIYEPTTPTETRPLEGQWHPIFAKGSSRSQVRLVAYFHAKLGTPSKHPAKLEGLIRNRSFERIPSQIRLAFEEKGLIMHPEAVYLDVGATPTNDLYFFLFVMGPLLLLAGTIVVSVRRASDDPRER